VRTGNFQRNAFGYQDGVGQERRPHSVCELLMTTIEDQLVVRITLDRKQFYKILV
jgi:hypothetical protein